LHGADPSVAQALRRATYAAAAEVVVAITVTPSGSFGERADLLRGARPDVVLAQADERGGDALIDLVEALRAGCAHQQPPPLVFAAGASARRVAAAAHPFPVETLGDLRRPEALAAFVGRLRELRRGDDATLVLRDEALEELARAVARSSGGPALVVDVTGGSTSLVRADADGLILAAHVVPLGTGVAADRVVARAGLDRVRRWIPRAVDGPSLLERVFNRARWPDALAAEPPALALEIALAHEAIAHAQADAAMALGAPTGALRDAPRIVLTGRLADLPRAAQSLLVALDALEPRAVATVSRERADGLVALGALAARTRSRGIGDPLGIAPQLEQRGERLAVIAPLSTRRTATLEVRRSGGKVSHRVEPGTLTALPASGTVELACVSPDLHGHGEAGRLGIVVDARGRPLALPPRDAERVPTVARWFAALDALPGERVSRRALR
ncbi:MAG: hypothetical protein Q7S25_01440, partial [Candidatus Limnocylindria bacterium]|nr:hypothetical protein [Candidatus Limnocylindria bacterium]